MGNGSDRRKRHTKGAGRENIEAMEYVALQPDLSAGARLLWLIYRTFDRNGDGCWWGDAKVKRLLGVKDSRTIRRYRKELKDAGLLESIRRQATTAVNYALTPEEVLDNLEHGLDMGDIVRGWIARLEEEETDTPDRTHTPGQDRRAA